MDDGTEVALIMHNEALAIIQSEWTRPIGAYPKSGYFEMPNWVFRDRPPENFVTACLAGARPALPCSEATAVSCRRTLRRCRQRLVTRREIVGVKAKLSSDTRTSNTWNQSKNPVRVLRGQPPGSHKALCRYSESFDTQCETRHGKTDTRTYH